MLGESGVQTVGQIRHPTGSKTALYAISWNGMVPLANHCLCGHHMDTRMWTLIGLFVFNPCNSGSSVLWCTDLPGRSGNTFPLDGVLFGPTQMDNLLQES